MRGQPGFFDVDERLKRLSDLGDQMLAFTAAVDFEMFRPELTRALAYSDGAQGGRPPFDPVMMFKILVIQAANTLSDERTEFLINDRLSFMRFLGLGLADRVPDARTIWLFREKLTRAEAIKPLFDAVRRGAARRPATSPWAGRSSTPRWSPRPSSATPRTRRTRSRQGRIPEDWKAKPAKLRQKDRDARWTVKFSKAKATRRRHQARRRHRHPDLRLSEPHRDRPRHGLIRRWHATDAAAYEGARLREGLLDKTNTASAVWADTAYRSKANEAFLEANGFVSRIHRKKPPGRPMPERRGGPTRSSPRSAPASSTFRRAEGQDGPFIRTVGIARATAKIGMANLVYNMRRLVSLHRLAAI